MPPAEFRQKGLSIRRRFLENDDPRELRPDLVNRARNILTALVAAADMQGVQGPPG
jgi:toxin HigB-1